MPGMIGLLLGQRRDQRPAIAPHPDSTEPAASDWDRLIVRTEQRFRCDPPRGGNPLLRRPYHAA